MATTIDQEALAGRFRASMRMPASSVSLITARNADGYHGMAVTSATSLSMSPPSMLVAVNRSASIHPVIVETGRFCLNLMGESHTDLLEFFSRSELRDRRFSSGNWDEGPDGLPVLRGGLASQVCTVEAVQDYGTHSIFVGRVDHVLLPEAADGHVAPLVWMNGTQTPLGACRAARN